MLILNLWMLPTTIHVNRNWTKKDSTVVNFPALPSFKFTWAFIILNANNIDMVTSHFFLTNCTKDQITTKLCPIILLCRQPILLSFDNHYMNLSNSNSHTDTQTTLNSSNFYCSWNLFIQVNLSSKRQVKQLHVVHDQFLIFFPSNWRAHS